MINLIDLGSLAMDGLVAWYCTQEWEGWNVKQSFQHLRREINTRFPGIPPAAAKDLSGYVIGKVVGG